MVMKALRDGAKGGMGKFILFGFLVLAVGGLILTDVGGFFRGGGAGTNNIIKVADQTVSVQEFDNAARRQLAQLGLSQQDAYQIGYMDQIIGAQIREILMQKLAEQSDIKITHERIAAHITKLLEPMTTTGQSPQAILQQILRTQGMTEAQFAQAIATEMKNELIMDSLRAGAAKISPAIVDGIYQFQNEARSVEYLKFHDTEIEIETPDEETLKNLYESVKNTYSVPETRDIEILVIKDDSDDIEAIYTLADQVEDLIAGGSTMQEIAAEMALEIETIGGLNQSGQSHNTEISLNEKYGDALSTIIDYAFSHDEGEISTALELGDGTMAAIHTVTINPQSIHPFDKVKPQLESRWIKDQQRLRTQLRVKEVYNTLTSEDISLKAYADNNKRTYRTANNLKRDKIEAPFNANALRVIFNAQPGAPFVATIDGGIAIINVTDIKLPAITNDTRESKNYKALSAELLKAAQTETVQTVIENLHAQSPAKINRRLLERLYGRDTESF